MGKIIAVAMQKGGVGKTTTSMNLAAGLAYAGRRVLLVDLDPQGNATHGIGANKVGFDRQHSVYEVLVTDEPVSSAVVHLQMPPLDVLPATIDLAGADVDMASSSYEVGREQLLKRKLNAVRSNYDYIIIDCSPSLGLITINSLTAADSVIIPVQPEFFALEGLGKLLQTIRLVQSGPNPDLAIEGFVVTMFDARTKVHNQVLNELREHFKDMVFQTIINRNIRLSEAPSHGKPIILYDVICNGTTNYLNLAKEVLEKNN